MSGLCNKAVRLQLFLLRRQVWKQHQFQRATMTLLAVPEVAMHQKCCQSWVSSSFKETFHLTAKNYLIPNSIYTYLRRTFESTKAQVKRQHLIGWHFTDFTLSTGGVLFLPSTGTSQQAAWLNFFGKLFTKLIQGLM